MVYYEPPKRKIRKKPGPANFASLPDEILLSIIQTVDNATIVQLREANSNFVGACNDALATRNKILYLHPTTSSLRQAVDICEHPLFGQSITEIVLLGKILWREIERAFPGIRKAENACSLTSASVKGQFCPWPSQPFGKKGGVQIPKIDPADAFKTAYAPLLTALSGLPNLKALSFASGVHYSGWNQTHQDLIDAHASKCAKPSKTTLQQMRSADVDVIYNLLCNLENGISSLQLDSSLPFAAPAGRALRRLGSSASDSGSPANPPCSRNLRNLSSLDLVLSIGTLDERHALERGLIACSAASLQCLKLTLIPQHARSQAAVLYNDLLLLATSDVVSYYDASRAVECLFQKLESLTLQYRDPPVPAKCTDKRRRVRPSCQTLDLEALLNSVRQTIRHVSIHNIIFPSRRHHVPNAGPSFTNAGVHCAVTTDFGNAYPHLEHFEWRINKYHHDPRCRSQSDDGSAHRDCDKLLCGTYLHLCSLAMYESTAKTLDVELETVAEGESEGFGYWDFGAAIMRDRRAAIELRKGLEG